MAGKDAFDIQQRTFEFGIRVIRLVDRVPRRMSGEIVGRQLLRSATAVGAHMQEADGAEVSELYSESDELVRILFTILKNARKSANRPPQTSAN